MQWLIAILVLHQHRLTNLETLLCLSQLGPTAAVSLGPLLHGDTPLRVEVQLSRFNWQAILQSPPKCDLTWRQSWVSVRGVPEV